MIRILIVLLLLASPVAAQKSGPTKWIPLSLPCGPEIPLIEHLRGEKELLLFTGIGYFYGQNTIPYKGVFMYFVNQDTQKFSVVLKFPDGTGCIAISGTDFRPYTGPYPTKEEEKM